jgi:hypothetical protein
MKASITITGQLGSIHSIKGAMSVNDSQIENLPFGGYVILFSSVTDARKALAEAARNLRAEDQQVHYRYMGSSLRYDAGHAIIN